jgi:hypothetical protein
VNKWRGFSVNGGSPGFSGHELRSVLVPLFVFVAVMVFILGLVVWLAVDGAQP